MKHAYPLFFHQRLLPIIFLAMTCSMAACKRDIALQTDDDEGNSLQTATTDRTKLTNDSIFLYAKEIYYWNENLPSYNTFNPRQYTSGSTAQSKYNNNLLAIARYSTNGYDLLTYGNTTDTKFSYIEDREGINPAATAGIKNRIGAVNLEGNGNDIGIYSYMTALLDETDESKYSLFINAVYENSPADRAGLTRGASVTSINGQNIGTAADFDTREMDIIVNQLLSDPSSVTIKGKRTDGSDYEVTLTRTLYKSSPIYKDRIIDYNGKKIGYLAYARFSIEDNSVPKLDSIFNVFSIGGVTDLVIDLRYNGGGYVSTAEHLTNLMAPSSASGTMYVEYYNQTMRDGRATILENQPIRDGAGNIVSGGGTYADINFSPEVQKANFAKKGTLGSIANVVFLVTEETASASELVINSLRPVMNVRLVGTTTYGKPIGFFPMVLENRYNVYYSLFSTRNSENQGDFYAGFTPGSNIPGTNMYSASTASDRDFGDYDFGDERELYLEQALNLLAPSTSTSTSNKTMSVQGRTSTGKPRQLFKLGKQKEFKGMIEDRLLK